MRVETRFDPRSPTLAGMAPPRDWMTRTIGPLQGGTAPPAVASLPGLRLFAPDDAEQLARLMLDSYRGTVDDGGETLDDARREVTKLIAGDFGSVDWEASLVVELDGELISATIVTRDRVAPPPLSAGEAFVAFSMTAPDWKRRGLARSCLLRVIELLQARGEPRLHLVVTRTNAPAVRLYRSLGFEDGPVGGDERRSAVAPNA